MTEEILNLSEIKQALKREELNFKIKNSELNGTEDSITFIDGATKTKVRGKIIRSYNEGEVYHWPSLNHENVARLIDILRIRDNLYIYLTVDDEITLKNIVHDENFLYDPRCFHRKRLYAKGIFDGLSYLHEKALCLMNLCDDNVVIFKADDRAIITNFDYLTYSHRTTRSKLKVPELYMAPETEKGEFDAVKAEIWASGILMLDMFLAHMVPWAVINYKPPKIIQIVDKMSLDLLQAANVGSVVTLIDLAKFQTFLKCFFKQNPLDRIPAKYASIASFLKSNTQFKRFEDYYQSDLCTEEMTFENSSLNQPEEELTICLNPSYDPYFNSISPREQEIGIKRADVVAKVASTEAQQANRSEYVENEKETDISLKEASDIELQEEDEENVTKIPSMSSFKTFDPTADGNISGNLEKIQKISHTVNNKDNKAINKSCYNCYQSKSLSFIQPKENSDKKIAVHLISKRRYCYSNNKLSSSRKPLVKNDFKNSNVCLNLSCDNSSVIDFDNPVNNNIDNNISISKSSFIDVETCRKVSEILETRHMQSESQIEEYIPHKSEYLTSEQIFDKPAKPPRHSKAPLVSNIPSEIHPVLTKLIFLRKCYISIQTHQRVFISHEFTSKQQKLIKEYQILLDEENLRLREVLRRNYELTFDDITKLIRFVDWRAFPNRNQHENLTMSQTFRKIQGDRFLPTSKTENALKGCHERSKYCPSDMFNDQNTINVKPNRNYSYYKAVEKSAKNLERKWNIIDRLDTENQNKERKSTKLVLENNSRMMDDEKLKKEWEKTKPVSEINNHPDSEKPKTERKRIKLVPGNSGQLDGEKLKKGRERTKPVPESNSHPDSEKPKTERQRIKLAPGNSGQLDGEKLKKDWERTKPIPENSSQPDSEKPKTEWKRIKLVPGNDDQLDSEKQKKEWEKNKLVPENNGQLFGEKAKKERRQAKFSPENKSNQKFDIAATKNNKIIEEKKFDVKMNRMVKQYGQTENRVQNAHSAKIYTGACPKKTKTEVGKSNKKIKKDIKKEKFKNDLKKPRNNEKKIDKKTDKEKKMHNLKKLEQPKSFWHFLCPGGTVENTTPITDALCETCKLNLDII